MFEPQYDFQLYTEYAVLWSLYFLTACSGKCTVRFAALVIRLTHREQLIVLQGRIDNVQDLAILGRPGGVQSSFKENFLCTVDLFRQSLGDMAKTLSSNVHLVQHIQLPSTSKPEAVAMYIPQVEAISLLWEVIAYFGKSFSPATNARAVSRAS